MKLFTYFVTSLAIIMVTFSCENEKTNSKGDSAISTNQSGFSMMRDSIKQILESNDLSISIYENQLRIDALEKQIQTNPMPNNQFLYAKELLNNGNTETAIATIEKLMSETPTLKSVTEASRTFYEFLAVSYLRKAEQENCQANHNDASCIVPIAPKGVHQKTTGSEKAIAIYQQILEAFPDDMQSRWLMNVAYMTLDKYPQEVPKQFLVPLNQAKGEKHFQNIATQSGIDWFGLSGGSIAEDFNNDGWIDLVTSTWGTDGRLKYYKNNGKGGFDDVTNASGLAQAHGGLNLVQTDYNNDGFIDIYVMRSGWMPNYDWGIMPNSLIRNNGDGTFEDVTIETELYSVTPSQSAVWRDFDNNGFLDIFVVNETNRSSKQGFPCQLFMNNGGQFEDQAKQWGMDFLGYYKGVNSSDINNDGWADLYISNLAGDNLLLYNQVKDGQFNGFVDISARAQTTKPNAAFPCWFFDFDNDGLEDIYVASYDRTAFEDQSGQFARDLLDLPQQSEQNCLYKNNGNGTFTNVTANYFEATALSTMGCNIGDINNDGFIDFYLGTGAPDYRAVVPNRLFENRGGQSFKDVTFTQGLGHIQKGHAISFADFNNDGNQDIHAVMGGAFKGDLFPNALFENSNDKNKWLKIKLIGTKSNKPAIGAKMRIQVQLKNGKTQTIYSNINSGASFGANPLMAEIGLGDAIAISELAIKWPNGLNTWQVYQDLNLNTKYSISEAGAVEQMAHEAVPFDKSKGSGHHHHH